MQTFAGQVYIIHDGWKFRRYCNYVARWGYMVDWQNDIGDMYIRPSTANDKDILIFLVQMMAREVLLLI